MDRETEHYLMGLFTGLSMACGIIAIVLSLLSWVI